MSKILKLAGIYDQQSIKFGIDQDIFHYGFDFRPRSPNFLQEYAFKEILEKNFDHRIHFYLHYQDEKDFMIMRMFDEIKNSMDAIGRERSVLNNFILYFSDVKEIPFYKSMPLNFIWEYHPLGDIDRIISCDNNIGISLPFKLIEEAVRNNTLNDIVLKILKAKQIKNKTSTNPDNFKISLQLDWDSDIIPSLSEFLTIDLIELPMNSLVESSYRHLDFSKISLGLEEIKNITYPNL